ncbi:hypothetical protein AbraIFM66951_010221 [Aspergillus brasiliensis]|uniref:Uncharacterized protein n=1 Tax=Aspergillus brasiliensis TaxID=319629 RepID=A0A9W5YUC9_9EURO|nr:hypothetical protein AbraCBS73388_010579 [Aspergillus brasiliensis]GKZ41495.1 hypothetical protein AbraIFM66951_010221 [Aspergillus brasiliensis]
MSTQRDPNPSNEGKHDGLSKYVKRMKMALRRSSTVKTTSPTIQKQKEPEPSQAPAPQRIPLAPTVKATPDATVFTNWGAIQEEKARALFAKYGLTLEPGEWRSPSDTTVQRVVRPIRMRVRRTCHRCQTTFGPNKVCVNCQHVRCKSCPRHPSTKTNDHRDDTQAALQAIVAQKLHKPAPVQHKPKQAPLTLPSRTGGQDVIHHPTRQRIHLLASIFGAQCALATRLNSANTRMAILEMSMLPPNLLHGRGRRLGSEYGIHATSVRHCTDREREIAPIVGKRKDLKQYEIHLAETSRNQTRKLFDVLKSDWQKSGSVLGR